MGTDFYDASFFATGLQFKRGHHFSLAFRSTRAGHASCSPKTLAAGEVAPEAIMSSATLGST
jgi:hypothetical protein